MSDPRLRSDNPLDCAEAELLLGVLVLGAIDPGERYAAEAHVASCSRCAATFAGLAVLPGLLHRIDVDDATRLLSPVPPDFTRRVLAAHAEQVRAGHERRRRTVVLASVAAAVALFLARTGPGRCRTGPELPAGRRRRDRTARGRRHLGRVVRGKRHGQRQRGDVSQRHHDASGRDYVGPTACHDDGAAPAHVVRGQSGPWAQASNHFVTWSAIAFSNRSSSCRARSHSVKLPPAALSSSARHAAVSVTAR